MPAPKTPAVQKPNFGLDQSEPTKKSKKKSLQKPLAITLDSLPVKEKEYLQMLVNTNNINEIRRQLSIDKKRFSLPIDMTSEVVIKYFKDFDPLGEISQQENPTENPQEDKKHNKKHTQHRNDHLGHGETHELNPDMLTDEMKNDDLYKQALAKIKDAKEKKWQKKKTAIEKKWRENKENLGKSLEDHLAEHPDNPESYITMKQAEAEFRRTHADLANQHDLNEETRVAGKYEEDHIGKQYAAHAQQAADQEYLNLIQSGKLSATDLSPETNAKVAAIYEKHQLAWDKKFLTEKKYKTKADYYLQNTQSPRLQKAAAEIQKKDERRNAKETPVRKSWEQPANLQKATPRQPDEKDITAMNQRLRQQPIQQNRQQQTQPSGNPIRDIRNKMQSEIENRIKELFKPNESPLQQPIQEIPVEQFGPDAFGDITNIEAVGGTSAEAGSGLTAGEVGIAGGVGEVPALSASTTTGAMEAATAGMGGMAEMGEFGELAALESVGVETGASALAVGGITGLGSAGIGLLIGAAVAAGIEGLKQVKKHPWASLGVIIAIIMLILLPILLIILIVVILINLVNGQDNNNNPIDTPVTGLTITLTGPAQVPNQGTIDYTATITCDATCQSQAPTIYDPSIPNTAKFVSADGTYTNTPYPIAWDLSKNTPTSTTNGVNTYVFHFSLQALTSVKPDTVKISTKLLAEPVTTGTTTSNLMPNPLPQQSTAQQQTVQNVINVLHGSSSGNIAVYKQAAAKTQIPWQVLAGIHYREGGMGPNQSLVSGRDIGANEPDVVAAGGCSANNTPGKPIPVPGGCGFRSLLDSAIYAGNLLKGKIGKVPSSFNDLTTALSRYNGGGNHNCGWSMLIIPYASVPGNCPIPEPPYAYGYDDPYVMDMFDEKHTNMKIIYCRDNTICPVDDGRPGTATITKALLTDPSFQ